MATVLIVDQDPSVRGVLTKALARFGHDALTASNAPEALQALSSSHVDLVICDWNTSGQIDGLELLRLLREEDRDVPVIILTEFGTIEHAVSAMRAFHPEAEVAVARAAKSRTTQFMLSTGADTAVEAARDARGAPVWQQLYATDDWNVTTALVRRAERAGCTAIFLTVDSPGARNNETLRRAVRVDNRDCNACHVNGNHSMWTGAKRPAFADIDTARVTGLSPPALTTEYLDRLRGIVKGKLVIKGVVTGEDATLAVEHGADGVVVSNHGGRNEETLRASIDCLPEVVAAARRRVPVFLDGGVRRGTDIFKALAMGAAGVGIGRPQAWGLAAFGQSGVEAVLDILNGELTNIMRQAGTASVAHITPRSIVESKR